MIFIKKFYSKNVLLTLFIFFVAITSAQPKETKIDLLISEFLNKGYDYQIDKKDDLAIIEYEKVLKLDKSNKTAYFNLGLIYAKSDRELKAIELADLALKNCTSELNDFYSLKGNCYSSLKRYEEALPMFHKSLMLEPTIQI